MHDSYFYGDKIIVPLKIIQDNALMLELEELFIDPIYNQLLSYPRLLGQHTFSSQTINKLTKFKDNEGFEYISHPYTREKFYITTASNLPKNIIIEDILLIFFCCKKIKINNQALKNIISYFIKLLLINQKKHYINNEIQDILLKQLIEILGIENQIINILSVINNTKLTFTELDGYCPSNIEFNWILFLAIKYNNHRLSNLLLNLSFSDNIIIDVNLKDKQGKTSFFWACFCNNIKVAKMLVDLGADIYVRDKKNNTPFSHGYKTNQKSIIDLAKKLFNNDVNYTSALNYSGPKLLCNYNHKRYFYKQNNQHPENTDLSSEWTLVAYKHRRTSRLEPTI